MKKKGFTLIELLSVIIILAIIALIAFPLIGNVIEKAKIGALENSVNGLVESANMYYANQNIKGEQATETIFDFTNGEQTSKEKLEYNGKVYNGKLILHASGEVAVCIDDKEHYAYKNKDTDEIVSGIGTCLYDGTTGDFSSNSPVDDIKKQVAAATATSDKVLEGSTIYTLSGLVAGTMANNANKTISATTVTESDDKTNALISIPSSGYYDINSKVSVPIETIKNSVNDLSGDDIIFTRVDNNQRNVSYNYTFDKDYEKILIIGSVFNTTSGYSISVSSNDLSIVEEDSIEYKQFKVVIYSISNIKMGDSITLKGSYSPVFYAINIGNKKFDSYSYTQDSFSSSTQYSVPSGMKKALIFSYGMNSNTSRGVSISSSNNNTIINSITEGYSQTVTCQYELSNLNFGDVITISGYYYFATMVLCW